MIEVEQISKSFNGNNALAGFSLSVRQGELFGLVGPNGAGKTTLIKVLSTLLAPDAGSVRIAGKRVTDDPYAVRRTVGYLADQSGLYQDMSVREFLEFFADAFHLKGQTRDRAIDEALACAGLEARSADFVEALSFGMKQRLMLAKTLIHSPRVLLLDEPANGLDPIARTQLRQLLKDLNAKGLTILISSHILADLEDICTRVALISAGKNVSDSDGNTVIEVGGNTGTAVQSYDIELLGDCGDAVAIIEGLKNVQVLEADVRRLRLEITGPDDCAVETLRALVTRGIPVIRFNRRAAGLEERYRSVFGGTQ